MRLARGHQQKKLIKSEREAVIIEIKFDLRGTHKSVIKNLFYHDEIVNAKR